MHWYKRWKDPIFSLSSRHSLYGSGAALFQQPSSQIKDAAVTWPRVSVESGPAQGGQRVQQAGGQSRQVVVVQLECGGVWREGRGQAGRGEAAFTAVHHTGRAGAHLRTPELSHDHLTAQHWQHHLQHERNTPHASTHTADRPQITITVRHSSEQYMQMFSVTDIDCFHVWSTKLNKQRCLRLSGVSGGSKGSKNDKDKKVRDDTNFSWSQCRGKHSTYESNAHL